MGNFWSSVSLELDIDDDVDSPMIDPALVSTMNAVKALKHRAEMVVMEEDCGYQKIEVERLERKVRRQRAQMEVVKEACNAKKMKVERLERKLEDKNHLLEEKDKELGQLRVKVGQLTELIQKKKTDAKLVNEQKENIQVLKDKNESSSEYLKTTKGQRLTNAKYSIRTDQFKKVRTPDCSSPKLLTYDTNSTSDFNDVSLAVNTSAVFFPDL